MVWEPPTEDEFNDTWITPLDALDVSDIRMAEDADVWALVEQLRAGQMIAVARTGQLRSDIAGVDPLVRVPQSAWQRMGRPESHYFWQTGHLVVAKRDAIGQQSGGHERYFNIRFDPNTFSGKPPPRLPEEEASSVPAPDQNKGGAPRKSWWDDLWIEMIRRIRADELHPESAAELQRTMLDWLGEQGFYPGEDTLKKTARKLFKYLTE